MVEVSFSAGGAEGTFKGADAGVQGIRREVAITPFTVRAKFEHRYLPFSRLRLPHYARETATPRQRHRRVGALSIVSERLSRLSLHESVPVESINARKGIYASTESILSDTD